MRHVIKHKRSLHIDRSTQVYTQLDMLGSRSLQNTAFYRIVLNSDPLDTREDSSFRRSDNTVHLNTLYTIQRFQLLLNFLG